MQVLDERDVSIDYAFMVTVEKFMRHGCENAKKWLFGTVGMAVISAVLAQL